MNGLRKYGFALSGIWLFIQACAPSPATTSSRTTTSNYNEYSEDLTAARPVYTPPRREVVVTTSAPPVTRSAEIPRKASAPPAPAEALHINKRLDALLDTIAQQNRRVRYAPGYRVQIYVGNERAAADAAKLEVYKQFPELSAYTSYQQPTYRLKVGDFMRKMDAERYFARLKTLFAGAQMQPDKVDVRRSILIK
ncbi:sporulation domain protein [Fibrella aestuarina BUZ 2]|uniref:Sporulation domain protein n=1 Tax=Fibrella aestuarina BUZ 2 TaxID=1166018 RepID=I0KFN1_9BACT|nr:SPOR domain-containing protein [Fibrella aestuarina]CCH02934.1 sporulation domain protein [Fibrella aestuarina BUZ 2]